MDMKTIPVFVQPPNKPNKEMLVGEAPEYWSPLRVARKVGVPEDHLIDGKVIRSKKRGDRWNLVAYVEFAALALALLTTDVYAQSRGGSTAPAGGTSFRYYDSGGRSLGTSSTNSSGTITNYDSRGNVMSRESTSGNQTTIYDSSGRSIGKYTVDPK